MFFYDWSNINRYSRTTMQHVTAVKIGGGGGRHYIMRFYYMAWSGCDLYSGNIKYYCSYYQFDQIQVCHIYNIYNSLQYNTIQIHCVKIVRCTYMPCSCAFNLEIFLPREITV